MQHLKSTQKVRPVISETRTETTRAKDLKTEIRNSESRGRPTLNFALNLDSETWSETSEKL